MPTVQNTVTDPTGTPIAGAVIRIELIAGQVIAQPGYTTSTTIGPPLLLNADATGHWSVSLPGNATITPANTHYRIVEAGYVSYAVVPSSGGPYNLPSILVTPTPPSSLAITGVQVAADGTIAGTRPEINLVSGANVLVTAMDNPTSARVDVTITSTGGGGGGIPSSTVVTETGYGQSSTAGAASTYSRGDHTHGSPSLTSSAASTSAVGDAAAVGTGTTPARSDHVHGREAFGAVTAQTAYGASSANGSAVSVSHSDHTHGTPALTSSAASTSAVGDAAAVGVGTTPARSDHVHGREAFGAVTAQTAYGASSANGTAVTVSHSDHTHGTPALTAATPAAETPGASGAVGVATDPARADHVHALPAFGTTVGTFAQGNDSRITGALQAANNLSDVANAATARTNLGVPPSTRAITAGTGLTGGGDLSADRSFTVSYGTTAGTAAQGNDSRITGALQAANNLSDVANAATARTNLGAAPLASPTFTGTVTAPRLILPPQNLVDAATIATDASTGNHFRVTLGGNRTLGAPTNPTDGQRVIWEIIQDATGSRTITLDAVFGLGTDITAVTLTTTASKRDFLGAVYSSAAVKWFVIAFMRGY